MNKPYILHLRLCQLIDGKYSKLTPLDGQKKLFFVGVMTSSYRILQTRVSYLCQSFFSMKQFLKSADVFQRNQLKPVIIAHWPTS